MSRKKKEMPVIEAVEITAVIFQHCDQGGKNGVYFFLSGDKGYQKDDKKYYYKPYQSKGVGGSVKAFRWDPEI